jgi:hypothetical protein
MSDGANDRAGTVWDWPVGVIVGGAALTLFGVWPLGVPLLAFGVVALLIRRGAFAPRRR